MVFTAGTEPIVDNPRAHAVSSRKRGLLPRTSMDAGDLDARGFHHAPPAVNSLRYCGRGRARLKAEEVCHELGHMHPVNFSTRDDGGAIHDLLYKDDSSGAIR